MGMRPLMSRRLVGTLAAGLGCAAMVIAAPGAHASGGHHARSHSTPGAVNMKCRRTPYKVTAQPAAETAMQLGQPAPGFTAARLDCGRYTLANATGTGQSRRVTLINFFASWCEYCIAEAPDLTKFYKTYHSKGLNAVGIDTADDGPPPGNPALFYKKFHFPFVSVWDAAPPASASNPASEAQAQDEIWNAYATQPAVACIPTTFWLHKDGTIAVVYVGQMTPAVMVQNFKWAQQSQAADENDPNYLATEAQASKCTG
jgi:thiol-disulfide isomerase/thioredoxin